MPSRAKAIREMVETRRLYRFEQVFMRPDTAPAQTLRARSRGYLQALATRVWAKHGRKGVGVPSVTLRPDCDWSWCLGYTEIHLSTSGRARGGWMHNNTEVLLHELVHAIGYRSHGRGFVRKYVELLVEYGGYHEGELRLALTLFNIRS